MRTGSDQRSRGRFNANRPAAQRQAGPLRSHTVDSNGPGERIRGNAVQIYERYLTLARESERSDDRVVAENYFQHAEHYFRLSKAGRDSEPAGTSRPPEPATVEPGSATVTSNETGLDRAQRRADDDQAGS